MGLQAEGMGLLIVGIKGHLPLGHPGALHLVRHLHILMAPHVRAHRGRQTVEGRLLQKVPPEGVPADGQQLLVGVHGLHHAAALAALQGAGAGEAFVPCEMPYGHAVPLLQLFVEIQGEGVRVLPGEQAHLRP